MRKKLFFVVPIFLWSCANEPVLQDPRIPRVELPQEKSNLLLKQVNSLESEDRECFKNYISEYQKKVFEHCEQDGYAENIGGGCYHIVGYSLSDALFLRAFESCNVQPQI